MNKDNPGKQLLDLATKREIMMIGGCHFPLGINFAHMETLIFAESIRRSTEDFVIALAKLEDSMRGTITDMITLDNLINVLPDPEQLQVNTQPKKKIPFYACNKPDYSTKFKEDKRGKKHRNFSKTKK